jgi:glutaconate CoA-transferase subunit B
VFFIVRLGKRTFVERIDFCTSAGHLSGKPGERAALGMPGLGPQLVVTDKAIFRFDRDTGEMLLSSLHPGVAIEEVQAGVGWPLRVASDLKTTEPPTAEELRLIREELDPGGAYTGE